MKYTRKCPNCHRRATKRHGGYMFCEECWRSFRRRANRKKYDAFYEEVPVLSCPDGGTICVLVKRKIH